MSMEASAVLAGATSHMLTEAGVRGLEHITTVPSVHQRAFALREKIDKVEADYSPRVLGTGVPVFIATKNPRDLNPQVIYKLRGLRGFSEANLAVLKTPAVKEVLRDRAAMLKQADQLTEGTDPLTRIQARTQVFPGPIHALFDFDGTLTDPREQIRMGFGRTDYDPLLPGSRLYDRLMRGDAKLFSLMHAAGWDEIVRNHRDLFAEAGRVVPLRPGVGELIEYIIVNLGGRVDIVSTNFLPLIESMLRRIPHGNHVRVHAIDSDDITSTKKGEIALLIAGENPRHALHVIGDGRSDKPFLKARGQISGFHALDGESFARELARYDDVSYLPFPDAHVIRANMVKIAA